MNSEPKKKFPFWLIILIVVNTCLLIYFISSFIKVNPSSNQKESGYVLLDFADQYREISSLMIRRNLESDYESLDNLLYEAKNLVEDVEKVTVTPRYTEAKDLLLSWMYSDSIYYIMILQNEPTEEIQVASERSLNNFTSFLEEMVSLGHDLK